MKGIRIAAFLLPIVLLSAAFITLQLKKENIKFQQSQIQNKVDFPTTTPNPITLIFTGDVIPARSVNSKMVRLNNFLYPFEKTAEFLKQADLTIVNLEAPLIENCPVTDTGFVFCGDPRFVDGLVFAGVDLANLANNHSTNYGKTGVDSTAVILSQAGILTVGTNDIIYTEIKGGKLAFLAYNGVSPFDNNISNIDKEKIIRELAEAKKTPIILLFFITGGKNMRKILLQIHLLRHLTRLKLAVSQ